MKKIIAFLVVSFMVSSLLLNVAFASNISPNSGIINTFPTEKIFYRENGSGNIEVSAIYTRNNEINFSLTGTDVDVYNTKVYIRKETRWGNGTYENRQLANTTYWSSGGQFGGTAFCRIILPAEGRYKVTVEAFSSNGYYRYNQHFNVVYSDDLLRNAHNNGTVVVDEAWTNFWIFGINNGGSINVHARVHDLAGRGISKEDIRIGLSNMEIMQLSQGRATSDWANNIVVTKSPDQDIYYITGTVNADFFNNRPGEYYFHLSILQTRSNGSRSYSHWGRMVPNVFIVP
ncbi:UNVERIFIED_CONTAM: hypothetical protein Cloal_0287 [Acetivibrio alkalicellulosi]